MLTNTLTLSPCLIAVPSELFQFSPPYSQSHISSVPVFITATFISVSFKLPSLFVLPQTNDHVGSVSALSFFLLSTPVWLILVFLIGPCTDDWAVAQTFSLSYHWCAIELQTLRDPALSGEWEAVIYKVTLCLMHFPNLWMQKILCRTH